MDIVIHDPCVGDQRAPVVKDPWRRYLIRVRDEIIDRSDDAHVESNLANYDKLFEYMLKKMDTRSKGGFLDHTRFFESVYRAQPALHSLTHAATLPSFTLPVIGFPIIQDGDDKEQESARLLWLTKMFNADNSRMDHHVNALWTSEELLKHVAKDYSDVNDLRVVSSMYFWTHRDDFVPGFYSGPINERTYK